MDKRISGPLEQNEIENAEQTIIRINEMEMFSSEINCLKEGREIPQNSKINSLCPILVDDGILRANSRINGADFLNYNTRYPIILPRGMHITQLIVKYYHENGKHVRGINGTLLICLVNIG